MEGETQGQAPPRPVRFGPPHLGKKSPAKGAFAILSTPLSPGNLRPSIRSMAKVFSVPQ
jgi:hypothetical protein